MFPVDLISFRAFILSSVAFLVCFGGTSTEAKLQYLPLLEVLTMCGTQRWMLVCKVLTNISYPCLFVLYFLGLKV